MSTRAPAQDIHSRISLASHGVAALHKRERGMMNLGNCVLCHQPEHPGACMVKSEKAGPAPDMGGKKAPGRPGKPGKELPQDDGSGGEIKGTKGKLGKDEMALSEMCKYCAGKGCKTCGGGGKVKKTAGPLAMAEPPMGAKPPSGQNPAKPAMPKAGSPKVGAAPAAPAMGKSELENAAGYHYAGLFAAVLRKDDAAAREHARLYSAYVRALGADPQKVSPTIKQRAGAHGAQFADRMLKNERGFVEFPTDNLIKAVIAAPGAAAPAKPAAPMGQPPKPATGGVKAPGVTPVGAPPGKTLMQLRQNAFGRGKTAGAAPATQGAAAAAKPAVGGAPKPAGGAAPKPQ